MAAEFPEIDFHSYHEQELPRLLREGRGVLAATAANRLGPFAFRVTGGSGGDGESYTYRVGSGGVEQSMAKDVFPTAPVLITGCRS